MKNIIIAVLIFVLAGGGGYFIGKSGNVSSADIKKAQDSISMMKEQSAAITKMGELMKTNGSMMKEAGMKYNDEALQMSGKDMEALAAKYMKDNESQTTNSASMKGLMAK